MGDVVGNLVVLVLGLLFLRFVVRVFTSGPFGRLITVALVAVIGYGVVTGWSGGSAIVGLGAVALYWFLGSVTSGEPMTHIRTPRDAYDRLPGSQYYGHGRPGPDTHFT